MRCHHIHRLPRGWRADPPPRGRTQTHAPGRWTISGIRGRCFRPFFVWGGVAESYSMLRNGASGPEIGLPGTILAGMLPGKHRNRPFGRPSAGRRADFGAFPVAVRPKSAPEARFPARKQYCVTSCILCWKVAFCPGHLEGRRSMDGATTLRWL